jgi:hypothetical protein
MLSAFILYGVAKQGPCRITAQPEAAPRCSFRTLRSFLSAAQHPHQIATKLARAVLNPAHDPL